MVPTEVLAGSSGGLKMQQTTKQKSSQQLMTPAHEPPEGAQKMEKPMRQFQGPKPGHPTSPPPSMGVKLPSKATAGLPSPGLPGPVGPKGAKDEELMMMGDKPGDFSPSPTKPAESVPGNPIPGKPSNEKLLKHAEAPMHAKTTEPVDSHMPAKHVERPISSEPNNPVDSRMPAKPVESNLANAIPEEPNLANATPEEPDLADAEPEEPNLANPVPDGPGLASHEKDKPASEKLLKHVEAPMHANSTEPVDSHMPAKSAGISMSAEHVEGPMRAKTTKPADPNMPAKPIKPAGPGEAEATEPIDH